MNSRRISSKLRARHVAVWCAAAIALAGCSNDPPEASSDIPADAPEVSESSLITVDDNFFDPEDLTVEVGTEVVWVWQGRIGHDVVGDGFRSSVLVEGEFTHTFDEPGTYPYVCTLHPGMEGTVYVVETEN